MTLPGLQVSWNAAVPTEGQVFVQYNLYRRRAAHTGPFGEAVAAGPRTRIAVVSDIETLAHTDHQVGAALEYAYTVTWTANIAGTVLESDEQAAPGTGEVSWRGGFLHDPADSAIFTPVRVREASVEQGQQQELLRARGRREDTLFVGEGFSRRYDLTLTPAAIRDRAPYERLRVMLDRQFAGAAYCLRLATSGEVVFGRLALIARRDRAGVTTPAMRFVETAYQEGV